MKKKIIFPLLALVLSLCLTLPMATTLAKPAVIPGDDGLDGSYDYYVAAHAVVVNDGQEETAWVDCNNSEQFNEGGSWAFCFGYPWAEHPENHQWGIYAGMGGGDKTSGKGTEIGAFRIWIYETHVHIEWEITEPGWGIIETHVAVEELKGDIPQNKNGNPKVGQFAIFDERTGETFTPPQTDITQDYYKPL
jgi:hypothetical protein